MDLSVSCDESSDQKRERVFAVGGLLGSEDDWRPLEDLWLRRTDGKTFHANDCESDQGAFRTTSHGDNQRLYRDLTILLAESRLLGLGSAMSIEDYRTSFPQDLDEHLYHYCLTDALKYFTQVAKFNIPPGVSQFTFHRRVESEHNAREVYSYFSGIPEWQAFMGRDLTFDDDASVRIQAADLVARESMKHLDNAIGQSRPRRRSWIALKRSGRFVFMEYRRDSFERMKARAAELHGPNIPEYCQWIADRKLGDNMSNRIHFMNAQDPAGKFGTRWG